jgi:Ca-activated chloride channel homolog
MRLVTQFKATASRLIVNQDPARRSEAVQIVDSKLMVEATMKQFVTALVIVFLLTACGTPGGAPTGGFGATPGGAQDMGLARELIKNGVVPPPEAFTIEGMFSEHDLPLEGVVCERLLCLRGALGIAPTLAGEASAWFQVGLSSTLDPATYQRPPFSVVFVVDVSGSMNWDYKTPNNEYQTPLKVAKLLMEKLAPTLTSTDEVGIVVYGSDSRTVLQLTPGNEQEKILSSIRGLQSEGATNMEAGLQEAYRLMQAGKAGKEKRLLLFTDVQPNVGATGTSEFENLVREGASSGVGLTVFGVGVGLGPETFTAMSKVRGGNAFTLFGSNEVNKVVAEDWPYLASPIAYDLTLSLTPSVGLEVAEGYGFPTDNKEAKLTTSTVFLSKRRGALLVRLATPVITTFNVSGSLSYKLPTGKTITDTLDASYSNESLEKGRYFAQPSVGKTVALAILVSSMKQASDLYAGNQEQAVTLMDKVAKRFAEDADKDETLTLEVQLANRLLELMKAGAPQGTLYGQ